MKDMCDKSVSVGYNRQDTVVIAGCLEADSERGRCSDRIGSVGGRGRGRGNYGQRFGRPLVCCVVFGTGDVPSGGEHFLATTVSGAVR